jgi:TP901 family phage tail tape measure protein
MFEAGSLIFRIQTVGAGLFKTELQQADEAAKKAAKSISESAKSISESAKSTRELGNQSNYLRPKLAQVGQEIRGMSAEARQSSREVGGAMSIIGAAIVATVGLTVKAATDWETAWAGVRKTVDGTDEELAGIEAGLRSMSKELPAAHGEIAAVAEAAGQLGVKSADIVRFTRTMIDLGETTNLTSQEAATSLAQLMNIMRTAPEDVDKLGSAVVALGNNGASTERDIVQMAQRIAGAGEVVGLTEGEVLGLANALSSVGIEAEAGGSAVSNIMIDISKAVSAGGDDLQEWARVAGMSGDEFARRWKADPAEALATVIEGMGQLNASGGDVFAMLTKLGQSDIRVTRSLLSLAGAGDLLRNSLQLGNEAFAENNALQIEAEKRYETTAAKVSMARNSVVDMAIELGEHLLPAVIAVAEGVGNFADFIGGLPEPIQGAIAILALLAGGITLAGGAALLALPKIIEFRLAVASLATTMPLATGAAKGFASFLGGPWGVAIAAAVAGLMLLDAALKAGQASSEEISNSLTTARRSADQFSTLGQGKEIVFFRDVVADLENMSDMLGKVQHENDNIWARFTVETHGFRAAVKEAGAELAVLADADLPSAQKAFQTFTEGQNLSNAELWTLIDTMPEFRDALIEQATALGINVSSTEDLTSRQALLDIAMGRGAGQTQSAADAYVEAAEGARDLERDLESLLSLLDEANQTNRDAITSNLDYKDTLAEVDEAIRLAREGVEGYALGLDENTQAGRDNMNMLVGLADDAYAAAESQFALDGSVQGLKDRLDESREALITRAMDFGYTREEAVKLADQILGMPTEYELDVLADTAAATSAINGFISSYNGRSIMLRVGAQGQQTYSRDGQTFYQAEGSVRTAADGYAEPMSHQAAQIRRGGSYVLWAEDETEGESFIPHAKSKRSRSERLLAETAELFGGTYIPAGAKVAAMADGAIQSKPSRAPATIVGDRPMKLDDESISKLADALRRGNRADDWSRGDA